MTPQEENILAIAMKAAQDSIQQFGYTIQAGIKDYEETINISMAKRTDKGGLDRVVDFRKINNTQEIT